MKLLVVKEKSSQEMRVAASPDTVKEFVKLGVSVYVEKKAGEASLFTDDDYKEAGAKVENNIDKILKTADIVLCVQAPPASKIALLKKGCILIGMLASVDNDIGKKLTSSKITAFALEFIPRITRAQSMDVLSSQSNVAGYKAVVDGIAEFGKVVPMMMTAAGTIKPAKILILGAGVAGLQAIVTAKRMGAIVSAYDVRAAVKEQVQSLGANFIEVSSDESQDAETKGGYAKEMSDEYKKKQAELLAQTIKDQDIIITTALIPGRPAPELINEKMVKSMRSGSVIVDIAAANGGNCSLTAAGKIIVKHGVKIVGYENMPSRVSATCSGLFATNVLNFLKPMVNEKLKKVKIDFEDEVVQSAILTHDGKTVHPSLKIGNSK